jgi:hypothetical protein
MTLLNQLNRVSRAGSVSDGYQSCLDLLRPMCRELRDVRAD